MRKNASKVVFLAGFQGTCDQGSVKSYLTLWRQQHSRDGPVPLGQCHGDGCSLGALWPGRQRSQPTACSQLSL